jgi:glycosyltransferase involved in cell wall biosynthesis
VRELVDLDYYQYQLPKKLVVDTLNRLATIVLCNSSRTRRGLEALGVERDRLRVIPNMVEPPTDAGDFRDLLGLPADVQLVGVAGWISPIKRLEDFIELASRCADLGSSVRFLIIGGAREGHREYVDRIRTLVEESENRENIIVTGYVEQASRSFGSLDVLVSMSEAESFGRTLPEAMALGTPVVGIRGSGIDEVVQEGGGGFLVQAGDLTAFEHHTRTLLADGELRRSVGAAGREATFRDLLPQVLEPAYQELYDGLLEGRA